MVCGAVQQHAKRNLRSRSLCNYSNAPRAETTSIVTNSPALHHYMLFGNAETRQSSHRAADLSRRFVGTTGVSNAGKQAHRRSDIGSRSPQCTAAQCAPAIARVATRVG